MRRRPAGATRSYTLFPYPTLFRFNRVRYWTDLPANANLPVNSRSGETCALRPTRRAFLEATIPNPALLEEAEAAFANADFVTLRAAAQALVDVEPDAARGWHMLGIALRQLHEPKLAVDESERAITLTPADAQLLPARKSVGRGKRG